MAGRGTTPTGTPATGGTVFVLRLRAAGRCAGHLAGATTRDLGAHLAALRAGAGPPLLRAALAAGAELELAGAWHRRPDAAAAAGLRPAPPPRPCATCAALTGPRPATRVCEPAGESAGEAAGAASAVAPPTPGLAAAATFPSGRAPGAGP